MPERPNVSNRKHVGDDVTLETEGIPQDALEVWRDARRNLASSTRREETFWAVWKMRRPHYFRYSTRRSTADGWNADDSPPTAQGPGP